jgi:transcriptional regulator with GAF, ATPase, and Fis domain
MASLRLREGQAEKVIPLTESIVTVGRDNGNTIRVDDTTVDPRHCRIERTNEGRYRVVDLQSRRGTLVNGESVTYRLLKHNDEIVLGGARLTFMQESPGTDTNIGKDTRPVRFRLRRWATTRIRRKVVAPSQAEKKGPEFSMEDLRVVFDSLVENHGVEVLDQVRKVLDNYYDQHTGAPLYDRLAHDRENLFKLIDVIKFMNTQHKLQDLLSAIMDQVIEMTGAERGFLVLREKDKYTAKVARNYDKEPLDGPEAKLSRTVVEQVILQGKAIVSADAMNDAMLPASDSVQELKLRSVACVPFRYRERNLGCFYIDNRNEPNMFTEEDLPLLQAFADQAAIAIDNTQLYEELEKSKGELERLNSMLKEKVERQYDELVKVREDLVKSHLSPEFKYDYSKIIGRSRVMAEVFLVLDKIIDQSTPVLILGESGTGKELIARAIHYNSKRKANKFVSQNCAAIPESLLESELFGHERGAFTGAITAKPGLFEVAHTGTLFLDEIADMTMEMQAKLLRAIEYGEVRRIGSQTTNKVDVRLVSATNKDLKEMVKQTKFREDLFYRLNVVTIKLPSLRERREDIPLLVDHFVTKLAAKDNVEKKPIDSLALSYLQNYDWPGNVRELENEIYRAWALSGETITFDCLKEEIKNQRLFKPTPILATSSSLKDIVDNVVTDVERKVILEALAKTGWKKSEAARILGISRPTLDAKMEQYGLERPNQ